MERRISPAGHLLPEESALSVGSRKIREGGNEHGMKADGRNKQINSIPKLQQAEKYRMPDEV